MALDMSKLEFDRFRERILRAGREVLAERGFGAQITHIVNRANVGTGTIYRYFGSKEGLVRAVVDELVLKTQSDLSEIAATVDDAREGIRQAMRVGFTRVKEYGQLTIALVAGTQPPQYRNADAREELERFFASLIHRGIAQGHFRPDLDIDYAVGAWFSLVAPQALSRLMDERSVEDISAATTEFFLAALGVGPRHVID